MEQRNGINNQNPSVSLALRLCTRLSSRKVTPVPNYPILVWATTSNSERVSKIDSATPRFEG